MESMQTQLDELKRTGYADSDECYSDIEPDPDRRSRPQKVAARRRARRRRSVSSESDDDEPIPEYVPSCSLAVLDFFAQEC